MTIQITQAKDNFPDGFHDALAHLIIAFGRLEYLIKLTLKTLTAEGFHRGMAHAESRGAFVRLCNRAIELANRKLPPDKAKAYGDLIREAITIAPHRNDNSHAFWTTDDTGQPERHRPFWNTATDPSQLEWRSRTVQAQELLDIAHAINTLFNSIQNERQNWPEISP